MIGTPDYVETALKEANMLDYTREFIEKCAMNHYYISPAEEGKKFCSWKSFCVLDLKKILLKTLLFYEIQVFVAMQYSP